MAVPLHGDSMEPMLHDGEVVGVRFNEEPVAGNAVVVNVRSTNTMLVKLYYGVSGRVVNGEDRRSRWTMARPKAT